MPPRCLLWCVFIPVTIGDAAPGDTSDTQIKQETCCCSIHEDATMNEHAEPTVPRRAGGIRQVRPPGRQVGWV